MKLNTFLQGFTYGLLSMIIVPLFLVIINNYFALASYTNFLLQLIGFISTFIGGVILIYCAKLFVSVGKGTPWPLDPPKELVTTGIYKYSRNPQFVASAMIWFGEYLFFGSFLLFWYAIAWAAFNHILLIKYDEPQLKKKFKEKYLAYSQKTPRYLLW
jgi:protein-S-isoprenylcysteine O-methyltransferase Ste14